jgi:hypothetical protein
MKLETFAIVVAVVASLGTAILAAYSNHAQFQLIGSQLDVIEARQKALQHDQDESDFMQGLRLEQIEQKGMMYGDWLDLTPLMDGGYSVKRWEARPAPEPERQAEAAK